MNKQQPQLFLVGILMNPFHYSTDVAEWTLVGIFTTEQAAIESCKDDYHFIVPIYELDKVIYKEPQHFHNAYFPTFEDKHGYLLKTRYVVGNTCPHCAQKYQTHSSPMCTSFPESMRSDNHFFGCGCHESSNKSVEGAKRYFIHWMRDKARERASTESTPA